MKSESTAAQLRAIESTASSILCVAGPGSGKTTVLTERIARIVRDGERPDHILAITYTNAAARNLEERLIVYADLGTGDILEKSRIRCGFAGTLHGFCLRMLRLHGACLGFGAGTAIIDEAASRELMEQKRKQLGCTVPLDKLMLVKKDGPPPAGSFLSDKELCVSAYYDELREASMVDFDSILTEFIRGLRLVPAFSDALATEGFTHLFVDEVQDCSTEDWKIFKSLPIANKFYVGDPDQAIFGFRGGRPELMMQLQRADPLMQLIMLEDNFRCSVSICKAANRMIWLNQDRFEKETVSASGELGTVTQFGQTLNEGDEIAQVLGYLKHLDFAPEKVAILARTNRIADGFREGARVQDFPVAEPPRETMPADWPLARAYIEVLSRPQNDTLCYLFILELVKSQGVGDIEATRIAREKKLQALARDERMVGDLLPEDAPTMENLAERLRSPSVNLSYETQLIVAGLVKDLPAGSTLADLALEVVRTSRPDPKPDSPGLTVTTIHAAKGREWDVVFLVGFEDEVIPGTAKSRNVEEERRLAFVAVTRARHAVYISHAAARNATWGNHRPEKHYPSRFLKEMTS